MGDLLPAEAALVFSPKRRGLVPYRGCPYGVVNYIRLGKREGGEGWGATAPRHSGRSSLAVSRSRQKRFPGPFPDRSCLRDGLDVDDQTNAVVSLVGRAVPAHPLLFD